MDYHHPKVMDFKFKIIFNKNIYIIINMAKRTNTKGKSNLAIIQDYVNGERPYVKVGYREHIPIRKEGEMWTDAQGNKWMQKNGYKVSVNEQASIIKKAIEEKCCSCGTDLKWSNNHLDHKMFKKTGKCYDCVIKEETQMRINGTYKFYEQSKVLNNMLSKCDELISQMKDNYSFIKETKNKVEYQNVVGLQNQLVDYEKWSNIDHKDILKDIRIEYKFLLKKRKEILEELNEVNKKLNG